MYQATFTKRLVLLSNEVPQVVIDRAQVVIISDDSRHIIGPDPYRMAIWDNTFELPAIPCPKIDVRGIPEDKVAPVIRQYIKLGPGVTDLAALKDAMVKIGAKVNE